MGAKRRPVDGERLSPRQILLELFDDRGLVLVFAQRAIQARYKQTMLGVGWSILQPVGVLVVFALFFGKVAGVSVAGGSYAAFALSAIVPWQLAAAVIGGGGNALSNEAGLVKKVYLSRLAMVVGKSGAALPHYVVGLGLLVLLSPIVGGSVGLAMLWTPLLSALVVLPALGLAIALAGVGVWVRDVNFAMPFLVQILMFASPVAYPLGAVSRGALLAFAFVNPLVGPLDGFRRMYVLGQAPSWPMVAASAASGLLLLVAATELFRRLEPGFADVI